MNRDFSDATLAFFVFFDAAEVYCLATEPYYVARQRSQAVQPAITPRWDAFAASPARRTPEPSTAWSRFACLKATFRFDNTACEVPFW